MSENGQKQAKMIENERKWAKMSEIGQKQAKMSKNEQKWAEMRIIVQKCIFNIFIQVENAFTAITKDKPRGKKKDRRQHLDPYIIW